MCFLVESHCFASSLWGFLYVALPAYIFRACTPRTVHEGMERARKEGAFTRAVTGELSRAPFAASTERRAHIYCGVRLTHDCADLTITDVPKKNAKGKRVAKGSS